MKYRISLVFLIAALMSVPFYLLRDEMDTEEIKKHRHWITKTRNKETYPIVFGGDSRMFRGLSPAEFSEGFDGIPAHNFAYWANGFGRGYLQGIENKVDTTAPLNIIVLGVTPHSLTEKTARSVHYHWELRRAQEPVIKSVLVSRLEEYFAPYSISELAMKLTGKDPPNNYRIKYHPNGWVESWWTVPDTSHSARFYKDLFTDDPVSDEVIGGLAEFVERWTDMGIHVVGYRPPASQAIRTYEREKGGFDETKVVERFTGAGGIWIEVPPGNYQTFDGSHLEHQSARRLARDLAREVRQRIGYSSAESAQN